MSRKSSLLIIAIVLGLSATGIAIIQRARQTPKNPLEPSRLHEPMERERRGTIDDEIALAKKKGKHELNIFAPLVNNAASSSLDEALKYSSVFLAEPIDRKVYWDGYYTMSWWKFKITATLSRVPASTECLPCWRPENPPTEWLPLPPDEIIFQKYGGSLIRGGVQITTIDPAFPDIVPHQSYLLFLIAGDDNVASARMSAMSAFKVSPDGTITPLMPTPRGWDWQIGKELEEKYQNSIHLFQAEIQRRKQEAFACRSIFLKHKG
jgi:hypothetical protein